jgi:hypothetical protein
MPKPVQNEHPSVTPPPTQNCEDQSSKRARGEGRHLLLEILKAKSSRTKWSFGRLLLLLKTLKAQSSRTTMSIGHLLLLLETLKAQRSRTTVSVGHLLLLLETLKAQSLGCLLLLLKSQTSRTPRGKGRLLLLLNTELHDTMGKSPPPPPAQELKLHPSTEQLELLPSTDRESHKPHPFTQQPVFETDKDSSSSDFFWFLGKKFRTSIRTLVDKCFKLLNHSERRWWWTNPARIWQPRCQNFLVVIKNINTRNH